MKPLTESDLIALIDSGLCVIPIKEGAKNPHWILGKEHDLFERPTTPEEAKKWFRAGVKSYGVVGGVVSGNLVVREAWYAGTAAVDLPGFGTAGEAFRLRFCSVMRFDNDDILVEWKDHG